MLVATNLASWLLNPAALFKWSGDQDQDCHMLKDAKLPATSSPKVGRWTEGNYRGEATRTRTVRGENTPPASTAACTAIVGSSISPALTMRA